MKRRGDNFGIREKYGLEIGSEAVLRITGNLMIIMTRILSFESGRVERKVVFNGPNLITNEGKGFLLDWLGSNHSAPSYTPTPFTSIVLTKLADAPAVTDTFVTKVYSSGSVDEITDEGVLHVPAWTTVAHSEGTSTLTLSGTITQPYGNDPANNLIKSVCACVGTANSGGPAQGAYSQSGDEKIFSRVSVGELAKTADKTYTFAWTFQVLS